MASVPSTEYDKTHRGLEDYLKRSDGPSPCDKLDRIRETIIALHQQKGTYWSRPCWRNWPCLWMEQHRSAIDAILERMMPPLHKYERECEAYTTAGIVINAKNANVNKNTQRVNSDDIHLPTPKHI